MIIDCSSFFHVVAVIFFLLVKWRTRKKISFGSFSNNTIVAYFMNVLHKYFCFAFDYMVLHWSTNKCLICVYGRLIVWCVCVWCTIHLDPILDNLFILSVYYQSIFFFWIGKMTFCCCCCCFVTTNNSEVVVVVDRIKWRQVSLSFSFKNETLNYGNFIFVYFFSLLLLLDDKQPKNVKPNDKLQID